MHFHCITVSVTACTDRTESEWQPSLEVCRARAHKKRPAVAWCRLMFFFFVFLVSAHTGRKGRRGRGPSGLGGGSGPGQTHQAATSSCSGPRVGACSGSLHTCKHLLSPCAESVYWYLYSHIPRKVCVGMRNLFGPLSKSPSDKLAFHVLQGRGRGRC